MLTWLSSLYNNKEEWEARRDTLRREMRQRLQIDEYLDSCVKGKKAILSKVRKYDGYTVQNICIETLPGEHIFGSIYTPTSKGKHALIICPNGHFYDGRYRKDQQQRLGSLARMGAICVDFDLYAWGESETEYPTHQTDRAHVIQAMNGLILLDWMIENRGKQIDMTRIGANGGSGGGTHTVLLTALDPRFTAAAPTVNLASHFDGGCPCESGKPIHLSAGGTCNPELLAMFAPNPVLVVSVTAIGLPLCLSWSILICSASGDSTARRMPSAMSICQRNATITVLTNARQTMNSSSMCSNSTAQSWTNPRLR